MRKLTKKLCALLLAALVAGAVPAAALDTEATCSITVNLAENLDMNNGELKNEAFPVALYRVADVDETYNYTPVEGFESLSETAYTPEEGETVTLNVAGYKDMGAGEQSALALAAAELAGTLEPDYTGTTENGAVTFPDLNTGLYLVLAGETEYGEHVYSFAPVLVSLPSMADYVTGEDGERTWSGADVYEVTFSLKPETAPVYGTLTLTKTVNTFGQGPATFIFQIEATMPDAQDMSRTETVYSNVVSMVFDGPGTQTKTIEGKIPLGATVTVEEVYSGADYSLADEETRTQTFKLGWDESGENLIETAGAEFVNVYNNSLVTGSTVENYFKFTQSENANEEAVSGSWSWTPIYDYAQNG